MLKEEILEKGTAVVPCGLMWQYELDWAKDPKYPSGTRWYRSKNKEENDWMPGYTYAMNKKWTLEEEFTVHMLRFQQVTVSSSYFGKLNFVIPGCIDWSH